MIVKIAVIKYQEESSNPRVALEKILSEHILPLLNQIEENIKNSTKVSMISSVTKSG